LQAVDNFFLPMSHTSISAFCSTCHTIIVWRGLATFAHQYIKKGALLYVEGKLRNRQYEDKEGQKKYVTEVIADQIVLLDKKEKTPETQIENVTDETLPF
jgi:single stranded DNA-binding protein